MLRSLVLTLIQPFDPRLPDALLPILLNSYKIYEICLNYLAASLRKDRSAFMVGMGVKEKGSSKKHESAEPRQRQKQTLRLNGL